MLLRLHTRLRFHPLSKKRRSHLPLRARALVAMAPSPDRFLQISVRLRVVGRSFLCNRIRLLRAHNKNRLPILHQNPLQKYRLHLPRSRPCARLRLRRHPRASRAQRRRTLRARRSLRQHLRPHHLARRRPRSSQVQRHQEREMTGFCGYSLSLRSGTSCADSTAIIAIGAKHAKAGICTAHR